MRGKAFHEEVGARGEFSGAQHKIEKLEEKEKEEGHKEDSWKAASEDLEGAIPTDKKLEVELLNGLLRRALGLQRWLAKLCFAM